MNWLYNNKEIKSLDDFPENVIGFVYEVEYIPTGEKYIGKKSLIYNKKKKLTKKELALIPISRGRKLTTKNVQSESDWISYHGSHDKIKKLLKEGKHNDFKRNILQFAFNKTQLTYLEIKYQMINSVLEDPLYMNDNINGKFYKKDLAN